MQVKDLNDPRLDMISLAEKKKHLPVTPLYVATVLGRLDSVRKLVEDGANPLDTDDNGDTLLHLAAEWGRLDILKYLMEDIGCPATDGWNGTSILHAAAGGGHLPVIKYLVEECSMDVTSLDDEGGYPLHSACHYGYLDAIRYLVQSMINSKDLILPEENNCDKATTPVTSESRKCLGHALCDACC